MQTCKENFVLELSQIKNLYEDLKDTHIPVLVQESLYIQRIFYENDAVLVLKEHHYGYESGQAHGMYSTRKSNFINGKKFRLTIC